MRRRFDLIVVRSQRLAAELRGMVANGAPVAPLALKYSLDRASALHGGVVSADPASFTRTLAGVAAELPTGRVTTVHTPFGFTVIKALSPDRPLASGSASKSA